MDVAHASREVDRSRTGRILPSRTLASRFACAVLSEQRGFRREEVQGHVRERDGFAELDGDPRTAKVRSFPGDHDRPRLDRRARRSISAASPSGSAGASFGFQT
jgi:hypothetical protein